MLIWYVCVWKTGHRHNMVISTQAVVWQISCCKSVFQWGCIPHSAAPPRLWGQSMGGNVWSLVAVRWLCFGTHDFCCSRVVCVFQHRRRVKQVCIPVVTHTTVPSVFDSLTLGIWISLSWTLCLTSGSEDWQEHLVCGASLSCPVSDFHQLALVLSSGRQQSVLASGETPSCLDALRHQQSKACCTFWDTLAWKLLQEAHHVCWGVTAWLPWLNMGGLWVGYGPISAFDFAPQGQCHCLFCLAPRQST